MRPIVVAFFARNLAFNAWAEDCPKAIALYDPATLSGDLKLEQTGFRTGIPVCFNPDAYPGSATA